MASYSQILITGGSGFLGWNLVNYAANLYDVYFTYCQHPIKVAGCQEYHLNLQDTEEIDEVIGEIQPEIIIHTAALSNADICEQRRSMAHDINVTATRRLAKIAEDHGCRFVYISTDLVFDGKKGDYVETDLPRPVNYYAETKLSGEKVVREIVTDFLIVRLSLLYGNGNKYSGGFTKWMQTQLGQNITIPLFTDQYRTPVYAKDAARAIFEMIEQPVKREVFHIGGKERVNRYDFGKKFAKVFNYNERYLRPVSMEDVKAIAERGIDCSLNSHKIQQQLSFQLSDVAAGLEKMKRNGKQG